MQRPAIPRAGRNELQHSIRGESSTGAVSLAAGDRLGVLNQSPADATLADVSISIRGTRQRAAAPERRREETGPCPGQHDHGRLIDTDGTDGGDDTAARLTVRYRKDGVAA